MRKPSEKPGESGGYLSTFVIKVQHRKNSTWQGKITWSDKAQSQYFRSVWEMIRLMESAINKEAGGPEQNTSQWSNSKDKEQSE